MLLAAMLPLPPPLFADAADAAGFAIDTFAMMPLSYLLLLFFRCRRCFRHDIMLLPIRC